MGVDIRKKAADICGKGLSVLPQDPQTLFTAKTVREDLLEMLPNRKAEGQAGQRLQEVVELTQIADLLSMHPYDISGGEQQRAALAKVLLSDPSLLLMDEPTKGMDGFFKRSFAALLRQLRSDGLTVIMVSHDLEFCARYASRCALLFDGSVVAGGEPRQFFSGNSFYTTVANRMSRNILDAAITAEDIILQCREMTGGREVSDGREIPDGLEVSDGRQADGSR
jgi:energy-coupling factor transport system ATP-binding protein